MKGFRGDDSSHMDEIEREEIEREEIEREEIEREEIEREEIEREEIEREEIEKEEIEKEKKETECILGENEKETLERNEIEEKQEDIESSVIDVKNTDFESALTETEKDDLSVQGSLDQESILTEVKNKDYFATFKNGMKNSFKIFSSFSKWIGSLRIKLVNILKTNVVASLLYFIGLMIYLELVFHWIVYGSFDRKLIYPILFSIPVGMLFTWITGLFHKRISQILMWVLTGISCLLFGLQLVYYDVFKVFFSFQSMGMAGDAISEFGSDIATAIWTNLIKLILLMLPIVVLAFLLHNKNILVPRGRKVQGFLLVGVFGFHLTALLMLMVFGKGDYTPYDIYHNTKVPDMCGKQLGIVTLTRFDLVKLFQGEGELELTDTSAISWEVVSEMEPTFVPTPMIQATPIPQPKDPNAGPTPTPIPTPIPIDTSPNVMEIDFVKLIQNEKDETIKTLHEYFAAVPPTNKNEYTGMFEGYNLIMITAEGFSPFAIHEELTPTLYKMTREGFVFNNFYTALWQTSTSDGEYVAMTGLIPVGTRSMYHSRNNLMPFALGHQFNRLGIESKAYHNHTYTYYQRNETHPNLGYLFTAKGNGLVLESDVWPGSDLEMINHTVDEFTDEEQFHIYYLTVSGHMNYTFVGNSMSHKNRELVKDLPYSIDAQAYIACQIELDRALEELIRRLTEAGVADKTVIALSADHYPYGWEKDKLDELAGHVVDPNFEIYRNHFILWNSAMEENIIVDEPASSLDIIPTLSNLFGLEYDSRLLMGQDIFSDAEPLVILNDRSFITDKVMYHSETGEVTKLIEDELPEDYIKNRNKIIKNKFMVSQSIIKKDYYRSVFPYYPEDFIKNKK